jgi:hypothetical protein
MNWFKVEVHRGDKENYHYVGSADTTLEALAQKLQGGQTIRLDQLLYYDRGKVKDWEAWDKTLIPSVVINPREVVSIMEFRGDPRVLFNE